MAVIVGLACLAACSTHSPGSDFFREDIATRYDRLATYPMAEQWEIFRYGNQQIHPPTTGLASVLARGGKPMADYVVGQVEGSKRELDYRDALVVLRTMQRNGDYDVCGDSALQARLERQGPRFPDGVWHAVIQKMQEGLCRPA
jgi:hypothetical protein